MNENEKTNDTVHPAAGEPQLAETGIHGGLGATEGSANA